MQSAKDSFYVALRDRLAVLNPQRTVTVNGVTRAAVIVVENEQITAAGPLPQAFYLRWGPGRVAMFGDRPLFALDCTISYWTAGTAENQGVDRGRVLAQLDGELMAICSPPATAKRDHSQSPPADLGGKVLWDVPELRLKTQAKAAVPEMNASSGQPAIDGITPAIRLEREAALTIFFYPEANSR